MNAKDIQTVTAAAMSAGFPEPSRSTYDSDGYRLIFRGCSYHVLDIVALASLGLRGLNLEIDIEHNQGDSDYPCEYSVDLILSWDREPEDGAPKK